MSNPYQHLISTANQASVERGRHNVVEFLQSLPLGRKPNSPATVTYGGQYTDDVDLYDEFHLNNCVRLPGSNSASSSDAKDDDAVLALRWRMFFGNSPALAEQWVEHKRINQTSAIVAVRYKWYLYSHLHPLPPSSSSSATSSLLANDGGDDDNSCDDSQAKSWRRRRMMHPVRQRIRAFLQACGRVARRATDLLTRTACATFGLGLAVFALITQLRYVGLLAMM